MSVRGIGMSKRHAGLVLSVSAAVMAFTAVPAMAATAVTAPKTNRTATFKARGSVGEVYVTGAQPGDNLILVNSLGKVVPAKDYDLATDAQGSKIFHLVKPGKNYTVRLKKGSLVYGTPKFEVLAPGKNPTSSFYKAKPRLKAGLNYITMRDGIKIAATVRMPLGKTPADLDTKQFPVYVEYSGYQTAAPGDLLAQFGFGTPPASNDLYPASSTAVGAVIGPLLGFVTVSVQMRGSGCSGGAFDLFGLPTTYDGYDVIETIAAQPWVKPDSKGVKKVGMGGISFSGISQLFVGGSQPPHLAAITPLSVTDDVYRSTGYPGGIFNRGFALSWITARMSDAQPAPAGGQPYAKYLSSVDTATGKVRDATCLANQNLRLQTLDQVAQVEENPFRTPELFNDRSGRAWLSKVKVPVFLVGAFQDEQTGGNFPNSFEALLKNNSKAWVSVMNGVHADSLGPSTITKWAEFMNLYVADRVPSVPGLVINFSGLLYDELTGAAALPVQQSRFSESNGTIKAAYAGSTGLAKAKAEFEKDPRVRVLMDNGAAISGKPGAIGAAWDLTFSSWPIPATKATSFYFGSGGSLSSTAFPASGEASYVSDPAARSEQTLTGASEGDSWKAQPNYHWDPIASGKGLGFTSPAFATDAVMIGPASVDLWLKSSKADTDIQVGISEVRPDGKETLVQNGWLRASHRKLNTSVSTALNPFQTHLATDAANLPAGQFTLVRVPVFPFGHVFRAGSKVRISIVAPGGDRQIWKFDTIEDGTTTNTLSFGGVKPSKVVLPLITGATAKGTPLPPAKALRGQPSRTYAVASNGG